MRRSPYARLHIMPQLHLHVLGRGQDVAFCVREIDAKVHKRARSTAQIRCQRACIIHGVGC